jgi:Uma2 family endonuclease
LKDWLNRQPQPRGRVFSGEIGVRVRQTPTTLVGIDVAYVAHGTPIGRRKQKSFVDGPPILAVEILSPTDRQEDILDKVAQYLANGVKVVWVLEPRFRTVTVYQPGTAPVMFNESQHLDGGPHLPGFRAAVAEFFAD